MLPYSKDLCVSQTICFVFNLRTHFLWSTLFRYNWMRIFLFRFYFSLCPSLVLFFFYSFEAKTVELYDSWKQAIEISISKALSDDTVRSLTFEEQF